MAQRVTRLDGYVPSRPRCRLWDGVISLLLAELDHSVVGVDFASEMLQRARAKAQRIDHPIAFLRGDAETLPLPDDTFELVTARHLVWTLPNPTAALQEWRRVVEPGGRILLIEAYWNHDEPWDEYEELHDDLPMYDGRPPDEIAQELAQQGLSEVTTPTGFGVVGSRAPVRLLHYERRSPSLRPGIVACEQQIAPIDILPVRRDSPYQSLFILLEDVLLADR